jgi:hypothetical protein
VCRRFGNEVIRRCRKRFGAIAVAFVYLALLLWHSPMPQTIAIPQKRATYAKPVARASSLMGSRAMVHRTNAISDKGM